MTFWGWLVFGDVPPSAVFVGGSIIAASGIYLLWEQKRVPPTIPPSA
jgi:drug/metabolite transporter (DMT)-like permease